MSSLRGQQQQHYRRFDPGGSPASSPPNPASRDRAWHHSVSPRSRRLSSLGSSPPNQYLLYENEARPFAVPNVEPPKREAPAGSFSYFCGWGSLPTKDHSPSAQTENFLLVGSEGCLDTYLASDTKLIHHGRLENLPGAVIDARIIPPLAYPSGNQPEPLVVLTIHGPSLDPKTHESTIHVEAEGTVTSYRTSVEIYSLQTGEHVCTLFRTRPVDLEEAFGSKRFAPPPPQGDLRIEVRGRFVVVASGISGEVFVFAPEHEFSGTPHYQCLAKLWTSIQTIRSASVLDEPGSLVQYSSRPILSLSSRWLALVPPSSASSINGEVPLGSEEQAKPPGFKAFAPPEKPVESCVVDAPDADTLLDRASKYIVQNSKALSERSREAWNNYWAPSQPRPYFSSPVYHPDTGLPPADYFPPTHGIGNTHSAPTRDPTLVSIYDLDRLVKHPGAESHHQPTKPLATFPAPLGCSFVSFSPDGRYLMTVSDKGEYQFIWHCFTLANTQASWTPRPDFDGVVREVARFSRNTEADIVDVAWKYPLGEVLAVLTAKGTIHVHVLPPEATAWPLGRRSYGSKPGSDSGDLKPERPLSNDWASTALSSAKYAFGSFSSATRRRSVSDNTTGGQTTSLYSSLGSTLGSVASSGSRFVAKGVTSGYGFASDQLAYLRHGGDNKIYLLPSQALHPSPRRIRFLNSGSSTTCSDLISVIEEGTCTTYPCSIERVASSRKTTPPQRFVAVDTERPLRIAIPPISDHLYPPVFDALLARRTSADPATSPQSALSAQDASHQAPLAVPRATLSDRSTTAGAARRRSGRADEWRAAAEMSSIATKTPLYRQPGIRFFVFEGQAGADDVSVATGAEDGEDEFGLAGMEDGGERWMFGAGLGRRRRVRMGKVAVDREEGEGTREEEDEWEQVK
ncbi:MAG: hypothetical protein M1821_007394 [Bathelium mastoideum]|nr:MAG: hypothetical protein M1821_007394 [Bathelium mastoideum]